MLFSKYLRTQSCMPTKFPERKDSNNYFISHDGGGEGGSLLGIEWQMKHQKIDKIS